MLIFTLLLTFFHNRILAKNFEIKDKATTLSKLKHFSSVKIKNLDLNPENEKQSRVKKPIEAAQKIQTILEQNYSDITSTSTEKGAGGREKRASKKKVRLSGYPGLNKRRREPRRFGRVGRVGRDTDTS
jgi:hypothetical protein